MKIKKTLFGTEVEFKPEELWDLRHKSPPYMAMGVLSWIKDNFGLNMIKSEKENK